MATDEPREQRSARAVAWFATADHPGGPSTTPYFEIVGSMVYPSIGHPRGPSAAPWYQLRGDLAFAIDGHPGGASAEPAFSVRGDHVVPLPARGGPTVAWFRVGEHAG